MDKSPPYYLVLDMTGPKSKTIWQGHADNSKEACSRADIKEYGDKKSELFDYSKTLHQDDVTYAVVEYNAFEKEITPELIQKMHKLDYFKRVKIKRFPWLGDKIWDIVKIIIGPLVAWLVGFIMGKFF